MSETERTGSQRVLIFVAIGAAAGLLSGLFGVGGGTVIVPMLTVILLFNHRLAAGTSLAAIIPIASAGVISYAVAGNVAWIPALVLAAASVVGAQIGTALLPRISQTVLRWGFVGFIALVVVSLFFIIPSREATLNLDVLTVLGLIVLGLVTGVLAGLLGVGGGVIVVPALMLLFGSSDLVAKGTSLMMMIPTAISGTIGNLRRGNVNLLGGIVIGLTAIVSTPLGAWIAASIDPFVNNMLFAAYLLYVGVQMALKAISGRKQKDN